MQGGNNRFRFLRWFLLPPVLLFLGVSSVSAQNKVVVVPLGGDEASQFRIVHDEMPSQQSDSIAGRLEYTADSSPNADSFWGTVCWDEADGPISDPQRPSMGDPICRQIGYQNGGRLFGSSSITDAGNNTLIALDLSNCPEGAESLRDCNATVPAQNELCSHADDIGIRCYLPQLFDQFKFRVVPGTSQTTNGIYQEEGRLEVSIGNLTGSVCADGFDDNAASLVCQSLGYSGGIEKSQNDVVEAPASEPIVLRSLFCPNSHDSNDCTFRQDGVCTHENDIGVSCFQIN